MQRPNTKVRLEDQRAGLDWAISVLQPLINSLLAQGKIDEGSRVHLDHVIAIQGTLEFLSRPDVEIRRRA